MDWFVRWERFMRTDLGLKGSELYVYAVLYGFTNSKQGKFSGSLKNIEEYTGFDKRQCFNAINSLIEKGLVIKTAIQGGLRKCEYKTIPLNELTLPEKQEKPKRKPKRKTAAKPSNLITDCETQGDLYQGIGDTEKPQKNAENSDFELSGDIVDEKPKPPKIRQPESEVLDNEKQLRLETWEFYKQAYLERYGIEPVRNARVNRNILDFVKQVGANAPQMIYFFVFHNNSWYVQKGHDTGTLLQNVQAIARDWAKGYQTTQTYAKQGESIATAQMAAQGAIELLNSIREEKAKRQQGA